MIIKRNCKECGNTFERDVHWSRRDRVKYCGKSCQGKHLAKRKYSKSEPVLQWWTPYSV